MNEAPTVTGMVLSAMPVGDYDKRLIILTKERGRISAFAKGAKKPNSPLLAASEPFSFGTFTLYEGRSSITVASAEITNYFQELRGSLENIYYGLYFCEFADYFARENEDGTQVLKLLYQSLRALSKPAIGRRLVRCIYELRLFALEGLMPQVFFCVKCGKKEALARFSPEEGGMLCPECQRGKSGIPVSSSALYTLQVILSEPIESLYRFTVTKEVLSELTRITAQYRAVHVDKRMNSEEMLKLIDM
ncbi:MAG: DNA repair protein RecO [Lachnospiraceae bacterium]|nr:DNA repair protein RecO [Lachnospiraceae bacterium]